MITQQQIDAAINEAHKLGVDLLDYNILSSEDYQRLATVVMSKILEAADKARLPDERTDETGKVTNEAGDVVDDRSE